MASNWFAEADDAGHFDEDNFVIGVGLSRGQTEAPEGASFRAWVDQTELTIRFARFQYADFVRVLSNDMPAHNGDEVVCRVEMTIMGEGIFTFTSPTLRVGLM